MYTLFIMIYRTFKQDCPVHITLRADENGNMLKVRSVNFEHNHEVSQVCIADCNVFHWGYCNHILYNIGAVSASSSAKAPYKRSEGKGSHSLENESQQKNGAATTVSRDRKYCSYS